MDIINQYTAVDRDLFLLQSPHRKFIFHSESLSLYEVDSLDASIILDVKKDVKKKILEINNDKICYLFMTNKCNMKCSYCCQSSNIQPISLSSKEKVDILIANYRNDKNLKLVFFGGEPLLKFEEISNIVYELDKTIENIEYHIVTNGTLISRDIIKYFKEHQFHITISIDGNKKNNDLNRVFIDDSPSFDIVDRNIYELLNANLLTTFSVTATMNTIPCINDSINYLIEHYKNRKIIVNFDLLDKNIYEFLDNTLEKLAEVYLVSLNQSIHTFIRPFKVYELFNKRKYKLMCNENKNYLYNDNFYQCALEPFDNQLSNIFIQSYKNNTCINCIAKNLCDLCSNIVTESNIKTICNINKKLALLSLSIYISYLNS